jgi:sterol desaturase/sphingolipid hydroxylase (fatty acid hydroxylase superfamily)
MMPVEPISSLHDTLRHHSLGKPIFLLGLQEKARLAPDFHHRHHAKSNQARDKNFAALFPNWDILFQAHFECKVPPESLVV